MTSFLRQVLLALLAAALLGGVAMAQPHHMVRRPPTVQDHFTVPPELIQRYVPGPPKPDLAVVDLTAASMGATDPLSTQVKIVATVKNLGSAPFNYPGAKLVLYRATAVLASKPLAGVAPGAAIVLQHQLGESYDPQNGAKWHPDYVAKIEYDPKTQAPSASHIDANFQNNSKSVSQAPIAAGLKPAFLASYRQSLLNLINQYRASMGRKALVLDAGMNQTAQAHSEWMSSTKNFQHASGAGWETIFMGSSDPKDCFNGWKNSPGHNAIMLNPSLSKIGIGIATGYVTAQYQ